MDADDRAAFGAEMERLKQAGFSVPPSVRGALALLKLGDAIMVVVISMGSLFVGGIAMNLPLPSTLAFVLGLGGTFVVGVRARREVLRVAYRALTARLDGPVPGAVGGATSAAFPALFSGVPKPPPPPKPLRQDDVVKVTRVGDPDAEDFDD